MKKKICIIAAALAAFFMFPLFGLTAYAADLEDITEATVVTENVAEEATEPEEITNEEAEDALDIDIDSDDMSMLAALLPLFGIMDSYAEISALPPGTGTVIDYNTDPDGRLFYTITTPGEHVFYLIIDKNSSTNNVYFLNAVTIADLAALAEIPAQGQGGTVTTSAPTATDNPEPTTETLSPVEPDQKQNSSMGMYIIIGILVIIGGGAGWYFKIYRPKQERMASGDEYDPSMNEAENDYAADWGDDSEDSGEGDDSPLWDEDAPQEDNGESGDEI